MLPPLFGGSVGSDAPSSKAMTGTAKQESQWFAVCPRDLPEVGLIIGTARGVLMAMNARLITELELESVCASAAGAFLTL